MNTELAIIIDTLITMGYDLRSIANSFGTSRAILRRLQQGETININYSTKARLLFLHQQKEKELMASKKNTMQVNDDGTLSQETIFALNCLLAKEIIEERLAIAASSKNVRQLACFITKLEAQS